MAVLDLISGTSKAGKAFQKRDFVIETQGQYPKKICLQLFGDKVNECPNVGEEVKVSFDIESREWNGKWFTQLNAWKVERPGVAQTAPTPPAQQGMQPAYPHPTPPPPAPAQQSDDLPF